VSIYTQKEIANSAKFCQLVFEGYPMTLNKWLKIKPMLASEFAAYMGVSTSAVSRWVNGHRIPRPEQMRMIYILTKKRVRPQDWFV